MKQYLEYDTATGNIKDNTGFVIFTYVGATPIEVNQSSPEIVLQLAKQGFTADEIVKLKNADLL